MDFPERLKSAQDQVRPMLNSVANDLFLADEAIAFASVQCWRKWRDRDITELVRLMQKVGRRFCYSLRKKETTYRNLLVRFSQRMSTKAVDLAVIDHGNADRVRQALDRLPSNSREVLNRIYFLGQSYEEVAQFLDAPLNTVKTWRRRGLQKLRSFLTN